MARTLIGNFMGPEGPRGPQGEQGPRGAQGPEGPQAELGPYDSGNMIKDTDSHTAYNGDLQMVDGIETFVSDDRSALSYIRYDGDYTLIEGKRYILSYDYYSEDFTSASNWIIATDDGANLSLSSTGVSGVEGNEQDIPLGVKTRVYVLIEPNRTITGNLRIGVQREVEGTFEVSNVSLSESHDKTHQPKQSDYTHKEGNLSLSSSNIEPGENILFLYGFSGYANSGVLTMNSGVYLINNVSLYTTVSSKPEVIIRMYHNDEVIYRIRKTHGETMDFSFVVQAVKGDEVYFTIEVADGNTIDGTMFSGSRNKFTITKLLG